MISLGEEPSMSKSRFLNALKAKGNQNPTDQEITSAFTKIEKQKRLSSQEFLDVYKSLWKPGPTVVYQSPDGRVRESLALNNKPNP
jgi:Ca2+-binding EF-hand superfamily protein